MDPNINPDGFVPSESFDNSQSFSSNPPAWQDSAPRFRGQGHYSGRSCVLNINSNFVYM